MAQHSDDGQLGSDTHALAAVVAQLQELWRERQDHHRAEKSLTLQIKARCRRLCGGDKKEADALYKAMLKGGDHSMAEIAARLNTHFLEARAVIEGARKAIEKELCNRVANLPLLDIRGIGDLSYAGLIGEAGNLTNYSNPAKLWKRMGLAVMPDGTRQRRIGGAEAIEHGYSPSRRSVMWNVGQCVIKAQSQRVDKETGEVLREAGPYRELYDERKAIELERCETKGHAHNRSTRYVEKRLLREIWKTWRAANLLEKPKDAVPPAVAAE